MLDIGFSELVVIGSVALVVLGPEKLAVVARSAGKVAGKAQRYLNEAKADLAREGELAELRQLKSQLESAGRDLSQSFTQHTTQVQQSITAQYEALSTPIPLIPDSSNTQANHPTVMATDSTPTETIATLATDSTVTTVDYSSYQAALSSNAMDSPPQALMAWHAELANLHSDLNYIEQRMATLKADIAATLPATLPSTAVSTTPAQ